MIVDCSQSDVHQKLMSRRRRPHNCHACDSWLTLIYRLHLSSVRYAARLGHYHSTFESFDVETSFLVFMDIFRTSRSRSATMVMGQGQGHSRVTNAVGLPSTERQSYWKHRCKNVDHKTKGKKSILCKIKTLKALNKKRCLQNYSDQLKPLLNNIVRGSVVNAEQNLTTVI